jgi:hypothetical protein
MKHTGYCRCAKPENPLLVTLGSHMFTKFIGRFAHLPTSAALLSSVMATWWTAKSPRACCTAVRSWTDKERVKGREG